MANDRTGSHDAGRHDGSVEGTSTTAADFTYSLSIVTGGVAADRFKRITKTGYVSSYEVPPFPLFQNYPDIGIWTMSTAGRDTMASLAEVTLDPATGLLAFLVLDCTGQRMAGATLTSQPAAGQIVYLDESFLPDPQLTATSASGEVMLFNVPPGDVEVTIVHEATTFRPRTVPSYADSFVYATRHP